MRPGLRALLLSSASHLLVLGGGVVASGLMHSRPPVVLDMTFSEGGGGGGGDLGKAPAETGETENPRPPAMAPSLPTPADAPDPWSAPPVLSTSADAAPVAVLPEVPSGPESRPAALGQGDGPGLGSGSGEGKGTGEGSGSGSGQGSGTGSGNGDGLEVLRAIYRREQFEYIRDRVARHLVYPPSAIRAGWSGLVRVAFVVLKDGRVNEIHITRSSGVSHLDRDAQETVRRSAPFPQPPVSVNLTIPVEYTLE